MENIKNIITTGSRAELINIIENTDTKTLEIIFNSKDKRFLEKAISTGSVRVNSKILKSIHPSKIIEALLLVSSNAKINFLRNISKNQILHISQHITNIPDEEILTLIESAPSSSIRLALINRFPIEKRKKWLEQIKQIEDEIEYAKSSSIEPNMNLVDEKKRLVEELSEAILLKEKQLKHYEDELRIKSESLENEITHAQKKLIATKEMAIIQEEKLKKREAEILKQMAELDEANRKQVQQRIEIKVPEYVTAAVKVLETREIDYRKKALQWGVHGTIVLFIAIIATGLISIYGSGIFGENKNIAITWPVLVFISFKGLVVLGVLGLWAKHAFSVSNAYMHEAIKRSDRAHAINFGKLYLEIYGNAVDRKELLDIFENWNITSESAFSKVNSDFEPKILDKLSEVLKIAQSNTNK
ncbi:hypothetical protein [Chromobacterium violaceum]|uniref:hypothetical protein n=1 Tax=Chromobacterium violaceum TaxID=536 RepID=UPI001B32B5EA|nr:hypothetical protein [Chromobacterium violaceum]MBP4045196.1 hypothetical protein [Chromobacterium violaceum]